MNATRMISPRVRPNVTASYYHGGVVHVRTDGGAARGCEPKELAAEGGSVAIGAETLISRTAEGPFEPLAIALERDGALRDQFSKDVPGTSLPAWWRLRFVVLVTAAVPLVMLAELDRELWTKDLLGAGRLLVDLLLAAYVVFELTRKTPRVPAVAGAAMLAVAMRWLLVAARLCGNGVHLAVWGAGALSVFAGLAILTRAPSRSRVALELMGKLGISRSDVNAAKATHAPAPKGSVVVAALVAAAGLPLLLFALRRTGVGLWPQVAAFLAYGGFVPELVRRLEGTHAEPKRDARSARARAARTTFAIGLGLALTAALLHGTHQFFDAGGELARCTGRLDEATRRLLAAEAAELSRRVASVRASMMLALMTTAVMPLAEERIFRGVLMNVLVRRYGMTYGLFASAAAFGVAHVGVYELALYQTVLLGIGFGIAYAEGGLIAAFVVHAAWNLLNVA
jgi:membrane protease YdiL (CAAX protease family)